MFVPVNSDNIASTYSVLEPSFVARENSGGIDFRSALGKLFLESDRILRDYADPNVSDMEIPGFGPMDKKSPGAQLVVSIAFTRIEAQLNTLLSGLEFTLKTLPQKVDNLWG